jgi:hypothetical protein
MSAARSLFIFNACLLTVFAVYALGSNLTSATVAYSAPQSVIAGNAELGKVVHALDQYLTPVLYGGLFAVISAVNVALLANGAGDGWSTPAKALGGSLLCMVFLLLVLTASVPLQPIMGARASKGLIVPPRTLFLAYQTTVAFRLATAAAFVVCMGFFLAQTEA